MADSDDEWCCCSCCFSEPFKGDVKQFQKYAKEEDPTPAAMDEVGLLWHKIGDLIHFGPKKDLDIPCNIPISNPGSAWKIWYSKWHCAWSEDVRLYFAIHDFQEKQLQHLEFLGLYIEKQDSKKVGPEAFARGRASTL
jgi:hypothetical protein